MASKVRSGELTARQASETYGLTRARVYQVLNSQSADKFRMIRTPSDHRLYVCIAALCAPGARMQPIAEALGLSVSSVRTIYGRCRTAGIPVQPLAGRGRPRSY